MGVSEKNQALEVFIGRLRSRSASRLQKKDADRLYWPSGVGLDYANHAAAVVAKEYETQTIYRVKLNERILASGANNPILLMVSVREPGDGSFCITIDQSAVVLALSEGASSDNDANQDDGYNAILDQIKAKMVGAG